MAWAFALLSLASALRFSFIKAQPSQGNSTQDSWPHAYPGMPTGDYSPEWQNYFEVTQPLPNVTWPLARNWAGSVSVNRQGHPNNTLFFWAFESSVGSFTSDHHKPWGIWLNGGPGGSSMVGLLTENGPIHTLGNNSFVENPYTWSNVADMLWVDNPVGTGYSTVDPDGLAADEDEIATDMMGFLENFTKVFPNLATRPLYIMGESYAGAYIPYIAKAYFGMESPPVNLRGIGIGDGTIASLETALALPVVSVLKTYPQIIGYNTKVFEYFQEQSDLCGYNITLQYPQPEHFPTLNAPLPTFGSSSLAKLGTKLTKRRLVQEVQEGYVAEDAGKATRVRFNLREAWKRDLSGRTNGTIDPYYKCYLWQEMVDYAVNFTFPWSSGGEFDNFDVPDALSPEVQPNITMFLNDAQTRAAIHAPTSKDWEADTLNVFAPTTSTANYFGDPSVEPMAFLTDLASNATARNVKVVLYSGNDDSLLPHLGTQVTIQNTTFGGIQGFTRKPETAWYNDAGEFAGIVHQERGWTYVLVDHAGHLVPYYNPVSAFILVREFIFGDNPTGSVVNTAYGTAIVIGGEDPALGNEILSGQAGIYYGSSTTASTYFFPTATVDAWNAYMATATLTSKPSASSGV